MPPSLFLQCDVLEVFGDFPSLPCFGGDAFLDVVVFVDFSVAIRNYKILFEIHYFMLIVIGSRFFATCSVCLKKGLQVY